MWLIAWKPRAEGHEVGEGGAGVSAQRQRAAARSEDDVPCTRGPHQLAGSGQPRRRRTARERVHRRPGRATVAGAPQPGVAVGSITLHDGQDNRARTEVRQHEPGVAVDCRAPQRDVHAGLAEADEVGAAVPRSRREARMPVDPPASGHVAEIREHRERLKLNVPLPSLRAT